MAKFYAAKIDEIIVGERLRKDLGDLAPLAENIKELGLMHPIVITHPGRNLIAGLRRLEACKILGWKKVPVHSMAIDDIAMGEYSENAQRKPFLPSEIDAIRQAIEPIEKQKAKERMGAKGWKSSTPGKARDKIAGATGVSSRTVEKIRSVMEAAEADPGKYGHIPAEMDATGNVDRAFRAVNRLQKTEKQDREANDPGPLDQGRRYTVILADVPWDEEAWSMETGLERSPERHYKTMSLDEIMAIPVDRIAYKDCALFFWTKANRMDSAINVIGAWGFEYKTHMVWIKDRIGMGRWLRDKHEILCIATKGNRPPPDETVLHMSTFYATKGDHSVKPIRAHEIIESYFPDAPRIELFARKGREGWDSWGNEAPKDPSPAEPPSAQNCDGEDNQGADDAGAGGDGGKPALDEAMPESAQVAESGGGDEQPPDDFPGIPDFLKR